MNDLSPPALAHFPGWSQVWSRLEARRSVLVYGPQFSGQKLFSQTFCREWNRSAAGRSVVFHLPAVLRGNELRTDALVEQVRSQAGLALDGQPELDEQSFFDAFRNALEKQPGSTLVIVRGGRRGMEEAYHALVSGFCELLSHFQNLQLGDLTLLVLDDYSMYFYENWRNQVSSFDLVPVYLRAPKPNELARFLSRAGVDNAPAPPTEFWRLPVATHGLILELLDSLSLDVRSPMATPDDAPDLSALLHDELEPWLEGGRILHEIQRLLAAQPRVFCPEALRHRKAKLFPPKTPDPQYLTEIGVLTRSGMNRLELCPGVIGTVVEDMSATIGTDSPSVVNGRPSPGELEHDLGATPVEDDDFLIVHLSDLHVGPQFRFHLTTQDFEGRKKAHDLLREDLDQFGIRQRIDALVVSGDFVEQGADFGQFQRAREVVEAIRQDLELDTSRVIVVAGNHDLDWQPSEYSEKQAQTGVSRENYETFYRLLGKEPSAASLTRIPGRGSGPSLRLIGLDSNLVEGPDAGGIGYLGADTLEQASNLLRLDDAENPTETPDLTWIVVHHHLFPATSPGAGDALQKRISTFANASELLYHARRWGAEMILHGHEHQPSITVAQRWSYPPRGHEAPFFPIVSAGAGSFALGSHLGPIGRNHYYIIHRRAREICFHSRILDDHGAAFTYHDRIRIPVSP